MISMRSFVAAAALGLTLLGGLAARAQPTPAEGAAAAERGNGTMGQFGGEGGDPALGEKVYQQKCAGCHDAPTGRTPAKAAIGANTPTYIVGALMDGVMRPMAAGLAPHDIASVAAYLSTRKDGGLASGGAPKPRSARTSRRRSVWPVPHGTAGATPRRKAASSPPPG